MSVSIEELDRKISEILSRAEAESRAIIEDAKRRAREIMSRPIPVDSFKKEAEAVVANAKVEAERIVEDAKRKAEEIRSVARQKIEEAARILVEYVVGLRQG